ncbi:bi-domain-containing oxidoreductase [Gracilimonas sp.]|uniref:bi-domain-containing oxidoreductase n=1 Tax=Gracilimonas sp. TaxID=1974203 RepID=UPI003D11C608
MQQLTQELKSGKMEILEVPFPELNSGNILVRNHFSVISSGTEGKTVSDARKGYIAKAKSRQKEVKQVIEMVKTNGLIETYNKVMNKLEAPSPLGYSCAGEVIAVGNEVKNFSVGDWVACGGNSARHADVVSVPVNLVAKVPNNVSLKHAAFTTIGAIAIQGIRQANLSLGENCLIIGMGLLGQITYKILEASGNYPIGIDISQAQVDQAIEIGLKNVYNRNHSGIEDIITNFTNGYGSDSIIITAGTSSLDPVEFAGEMARSKAKIVIVGAVPTGFSRTNYYKKELDLRMSTSYGPGRNQLNYEEKGLDYPIGYVRWTENRNMQSFVKLLETERIDVEPLITHSFSLLDAPKAYDMILENSEMFTGITIEYDTDSQVKSSIKLNDRTFNSEEANVSFIGAGSFAQGTLLPNIKGKCNLVGVSTNSGTSSKYVADKYGFKYCAAESDEIYNDQDTNTVFITTRHNLHTDSVIKALNNGKNVFVEKPLGMNEDELRNIKQAYDEAYENGQNVHLMVGFNRRFAPAIQRAIELFDEDQPKSIMIRVNAGVLPKDHWVNDPDIGGGRVIGEACHFIDLARYVGGGRIISVSAETMQDPNNLHNTVVVNLKMENGSIATINYFSNGNKNLEKEFIEIYSGGTVAQIDDFKELNIYGKKKDRVKYRGQDKGHKNEIELFLKAIREGKPTPIPFEESYESSLATCKVIESITSNKKVLL